jgi:dTDP-glucose 4,6-dehydratase
MLDRHPDYHITVYDKLTYAGLMSRLDDFLAAPGSNLSFVEGDICSSSGVRAALKQYKIDTIINFAAESHVDRSIEDAHRFVTTQAVGTTILLDEGSKYGIGKFVQISTDEVYGDISFGSSSEEDTLGPRNPYAASKAAAEMMVMSFYTTFGLPVFITRCSNNYGPWQHPEKFVAGSITKLLGGNPITLHGNGNYWRDWIHTDDHCAAIDLIIHQGTSGEIYNICSGELHTNKHIAGLLLSMFEMPDSAIEYIPDRLGNDRRYSMNTSKIRSLGWQPIMSLEEGLKETIDWYRSNQRWLDDLESA